MRTALIAGAIGAAFLASPLMAAPPLTPHDNGKMAEKEKKEKKEEKIKEKDVPAVVMDAFKKKFPNVTIQEIEKETYDDGSVHYEFEYKDKDGKSHDVEFNDKGEYLEGHHDDD